MYGTLPLRVEIVENWQEKELRRDISHRKIYEDKSIYKQLKTLKIIAHASVEVKIIARVNTLNLSEDTLFVSSWRVTRRRTVVVL